MEAFPDHGVLYRLTFPHEDNAPTPDPALVFDRCEDAWRHAAEQVLKQPGIHGEHTVAVASALLDVDEPGCMHEWVVSRWAKTLQHPVTGFHQLSPRWGKGITLRHHDAMDDTWSKVSSLLVADLLTYSDFHGVDAAVLRDKHVWLGLIVDVTPGGHVTYADGQVLDLDQAEQISAHFS